MLNKTPEISIILPCLNEEEAIGFCLDNLKEIIEKNKLNAEIIVVDNDSIDKSCEIVKVKKEKFKTIKLIEEKEKGYGAAYLKGFSFTAGKYIFMADCDGSYDFSEMPKFIEELKKGYELVIGNRFKGNIEKGAMPFLTDI